MENSPNSIEMQIDNFLEQFKRSASKAMDGDWTTTSTTSASNLISTTSLSRSKSRSSCLDIAELSGKCHEKFN